MKTTKTSGKQRRNRVLERLMDKCAESFAGIYERLVRERSKKFI